jgi:hypothetical protein
MPPALAHLINSGIIYMRDGFHTLHNDAGLIHKRIDENKRAELLILLPPFTKKRKQNFTCPLQH